MLNNHQNLYNFKGNVFLTKPLKPADNYAYRFINVCYLQTDNVFVAIGALRLDPNGIYYAKNKELGTIDSPEFCKYIEKLAGLEVNPIKEAKTQKEQVLFEDVVKCYVTTQSIKKTAFILNISEEKTRKILISEGHYTCEKYEQIIGLLRGGKSIDEVATALNMRKKQILAYLPYDRKSI